MTSAEQRLKDARTELERDYRDRLVTVFGEDFATNPSYETLVEEVARGRYPHVAISDRMGR
jgi:hypothetical protein